VQLITSSSDAKCHGTTSPKSGDSGWVRSRWRSPRVVSQISYFSILVSVVYFRFLFNIHSLEIYPLFTRFLWHRDALRRERNVLLPADSISGGPDTVESRNFPKMIYLCHNTHQNRFAIFRILPMA
jgi:hypothetical protein